MCIRDRSGNGNDATQISAAAQPLIVSAGTIDTKNSKPSINFDSNLKKLETGSGLVKVISSFSVANYETLNTVNYLYGTTSTRNSGLALAGSASAAKGLTAVDGGNVATLGNVENTNQQLQTMINLADVGLSVNGAALTSLTYGADVYFENIGDRGGAGNLALIGRVQELILYPSDQSANKAAIEANINTHYTIY